MKYPDKSQYEGEFKEGLYDGEGIYTYRSGRMARGEFKMGKIVKWLEGLENKKFQREMKMNQVAELDVKSMQTYINKIWAQFDTDKSGELDRKESKAFLLYAMDDLMKNKFGET